MQEKPAVNPDYPKLACRTCSFQAAHLPVTQANPIWTIRLVACVIHLNRLSFSFVHVKFLFNNVLQELGQLEVLCKQLYESTDPTVRSQAEKALISFTESPDCLQKCQFVLERGTVSILFLLFKLGFFQCLVPILWAVYAEIIACRYVVIKFKLLTLLA